MNTAIDQTRMDPELPVDISVFFRDQFRAARAVAHSDAEGFQEILFALERFGSYRARKIKDLNAYEPSISEIAKRSPLAEFVPGKWRDFHLSFSNLYFSVRNARNDALHQGASARHLTSHAVQLALVLEDALMEYSTYVSDYMVRDVTCAYPWQPISFVRQLMLANSFSYLPVRLTDMATPGWCLISDTGLATYLRVDEVGRKQRLATTVETALQTADFDVQIARSCAPSAKIADVLPHLSGQPILVVDEATQHLLGIVTAFDLL